MTVESILTQAEELTLEQRAELLRRLEAGLVEAGWQQEAVYSDAVEAMLDERIRTSDANPGSGIPWETALEKTRKRWQK